MGIYYFPSFSRQKLHSRGEEASLAVGYSGKIKVFGLSQQILQIKGDQATKMKKGYHCSCHSFVKRSPQRMAKTPWCPFILIFIITNCQWSNHQHLMRFLFSHAGSLLFSCSVDHCYLSDTSSGRGD